jgi:hypothetical protein
LPPPSIREFHVDQQNRLARGARAPLRREGPQCVMQLKRERQSSGPLCASCLDEEPDAALIDPVQRLELAIRSSAMAASVRSSDIRSP